MYPQARMKNEKVPVFRFKGTTIIFVIVMTIAAVMILVASFQPTLSGNP